jgi:SAM-dependent methyltransferase
MSAEGLACPVCDGVDLEPLFRSDTGYDLARCRSCGLAFTDARQAPPPEALYPPFEQQDTAAQRATRDALSVFQRQRAAVVEARKRSGRLLDYGAGAGQFARFMSRRGFEVVGLEPFSLGAPSEAPGLTLLRAPLASVKASLGTFDVITLWHVLEHVPRPVELLAELKGLLRAGGVLVVSVPNLASWQARVFRGRWFHLDPPRHLLHFDQAALAGCLRRASLSCEPSGQFLPEYGTSGWIQGALNAVLPHRNFLYEWVKDRGALRELSRPSRAAHLLASAGLGVPVLGASLPVEWVATRAQRAAALTVYAAPVG